MDKQIIFMKAALQQAAIAFENGEVPIGAIVVFKGKIIARAYNQVEQLKDATAHAEMIAMTSAMQFVGGKYLKDCTVYTTLEPCVMCAGAIHHAGINNIVYGAKDPSSGFVSKTNNLFSKKSQIRSGVLEKECAELLQAFFKKKREES